MLYLPKSFGEYIGNVVLSGDSDYVNEAFVDAVANEMCADVDVFYTGVIVRVVRARDRALIIAEQACGAYLRVTEFLKQLAQPQYLTCRVSASHVFGLAG